MASESAFRAASSSSMMNTMAVEFSTRSRYSVVEASRRKLDKTWEGIIQILFIKYKNFANPWGHFQLSKDRSVTFFWKTSQSLPWRGGEGGRESVNLEFNWNLTQMWSPTWNTKNNLLVFGSWKWPPPCSNSSTAKGGVRFRVSVPGVPSTQLFSH